MKRRESKIPLLLTMIVLGYFIFWAIGYVGRNRPAPAAPQPVASLPRPANVIQTQEIEPAVPVVQQTPILAAPVPKPKVEQSPVTTSVTDNSEEVVLEGRTQNRKLAGVLEQSTVKR